MIWNKLGMDGDKKLGRQRRRRRWGRRRMILVMILMMIDVWLDGVDIIQIKLVYTLSQEGKCQDVSAFSTEIDVARYIMPYSKLGFNMRKRHRTHGR